MEEELYSSVNNPLPAYDLLDAIYGIQAKGIVKFWVKDDSEMTALVDPLLKVNNITWIILYYTFTYFTNSSFYHCGMVQVVKFITITSLISFGLSKKEH